MLSLSKKCLWKTVSVFTVLAFLLNEIFLPASVYGQAITSGVSANGELPKVEAILDIPEDLGKIESFSNGDGPTLVHIQTAHGNYEAQKKIEGILQHLKDEFAFDLVLLEGSAFKLTPELLHLFPNRMKETWEILDQLTRDAFVKGPELFLAKNLDVSGYGIEEVSTYRNNNKVFVEVLQAQSETGLFLVEMDKQIERLTSPYLNSTLKNVIKQFERYQDELYPFMDWLNFIKDKAEKHLNIDLADVAYQVDWPMLLRVFTLKEFEKEFKHSEFPAEKEAFLEGVRRFIPRDDLELLKIEKLLKNPTSRHQLADPETYLLFENLVRRLPENFDYSQFPNVKIVVGRLILQSELKSSLLMEEMDQVLKQIFQVLVQNEKEREILSVLQDYWLLKNLFKLELTPNEYDQVLAKISEKGDLTTLSPEVIVSRFIKIDNKKRVRSAEFKNLDSIKKTFNSSLKFYELVKARDSHMIKNVEARINEMGAKKAVVITGGFHAEPFREHFEVEGFNYALVMPKITSREGKNAYVETMISTSTSTIETAPFASHFRKNLELLGVDWREAYMHILRRAHQKMILVLKGKNSAFNKELKTSQLLGGFDVKPVKIRGNAQMGVFENDERFAVVSPASVISQSTQEYLTLGKRVRYAPTTTLLSESRSIAELPKTEIESKEKLVAEFESGRVSRRKSASRSEVRKERELQLVLNSELSSSGVSVEKIASFLKRKKETLEPGEIYEYSGRLNFLIDDPEGALEKGILQIKVSIERLEDEAPSYRLDFEPVNYTSNISKFSIEIEEGRDLNASFLEESVNNLASEYGPSENFERVLKSFLLEQQDPLTTPHSSNLLRLAASLDGHRNEIESKLIKEDLTLEESLSRLKSILPEEVVPMGENTSASWSLILVHVYKTFIRYQALDAELDQMDIFQEDLRTILAPENRYTPSERSFIRLFWIAAGFEDSPRLDSEKVRVRVIIDHAFRTRPWKSMWRRGLAYIVSQYQAVTNLSFPRKIFRAISKANESVIGAIKFLISGFINLAIVAAFFSAMFAVGLVVIWFFVGPRAYESAWSESEEQAIAVKLEDSFEKKDVVSIKMLLSESNRELQIFNDNKQNFASKPDMRITVRQNKEFVITMAELMSNELSNVRNRLGGFRSRGWRLQLEEVEQKAIQSGDDSELESLLDSLLEEIKKEDEFLLSSQKRIDEFFENQKSILSFLNKEKLLDVEEHVENAEEIIQLLKGEIQSERELVEEFEDRMLNRRENTSRSEVRTDFRDLQIPVNQSSENQMGTSTEFLALNTELVVKTARIFTKGIISWARRIAIGSVDAVISLVRETIDRRVFSSVLPESLGIDFERFEIDSIERQFLGYSRELAELRASTERDITDHRAKISVPKSFDKILRMLLTDPFKVNYTLWFDVSVAEVDDFREALKVYAEETYGEYPEGLTMMVTPANPVTAFKGSLRRGVAAAFLSHNEELAAETAQRGVKLIRVHMDGDPIQADEIGQLTSGMLLNEEQIYFTQFENVIKGSDLLSRFLKATISDMKAKVKVARSA